MLILTRKKHEAIVIGDITIMVVAIQGSSVRIGIKAPAHINVRRGELPDQEGDR